jgi:hypothetical protein
VKLNEWLLPVSIVLAALILAIAFRYEPYPHIADWIWYPTLDRWTGCVSFRTSTPQSEDKFESALIEVRSYHRVCPSAQ